MQGIYPTDFCGITRSRFFPPAFQRRMASIQIWHLLFFIFTGLLSTGYSQAIENVQASFNSGKVTVLYDLVGSSERQEYSVVLYSSHNNFSHPLQKVSGDIGRKIRGGKARKIEWDAASEISGAFKGEITFRIRAEVLAMPLAFIYPSEKGYVRRGKDVSIKWEGGLSTQNVSIDLFKGTQRVSTIVQSQNTGNFAWSVPSDITKGNDYQLRLSNAAGESKTLNLSIKARIPLVLKLLPIAIIGGVVAAVSGGGGGEPNGSSFELPAAPGPK